VPEALILFSLMGGFLVVLSRALWVVAVLTGGSGEDDEVDHSERIAKRLPYGR
jgi:hypothetical protein